MQSFEHNSDAAMAFVGELQRDYSAIAPEYDETRYTGRRAAFVFDYESQLLLELLTEHIGSRELIIDVACGTGQFTQLWPMLFKRVVGVDLTLAMLRRASQKIRAEDRARVSFIRGSATDLPLRRESADVLITTRFLHLFPRQQHRQILETMFAAVRPGGILIVEHDGPVMEWVAAFRAILCGSRKTIWSSYHAAEAPTSARMIGRWGVLCPGLPWLAMAFPKVARRIARLFLCWPLNRLAIFAVIMYEKPRTKS